MSEVIWSEQSVYQGRSETYHVVFFRVKCPRFCFIYSVMLGVHNLEDARFLQNPSGEGVDKFSVASLQSMCGNVAR